MTSKRKMLERTFDEAKLESDSEDKNPRTADQAPALSKHKTRQYRDDILLDIAQDWVDIAEKLGPEATIELLNAYKDTVIRVVDAKVAEHNRLMQIAAAEDPVQEADGKAGSSGTEPPRTPAKTAAVLPTPPSTGIATLRTASWKAAREPSGRRLFVPTRSLRPVLRHLPTRRSAKKPASFFRRRNEVPTFLS